MTTEAPVLAARDGAVLTLTINRPRYLNALDPTLLEALLGHLRSAALDDSVRAVVLTGAGRAFCAGGDLRRMTEMNPARPGNAIYELAATFHLCIQEIRRMKKPVIAALNGVAAGGGFSLALACDMRVMAASAKLQLAYTSAGLAVDGGCSFMLPRLVGLARALELAMLDEPVSSEQALREGLVTRVVPDAELAQEAAALASRVAERAVGAIGRVKRLMNGAFERGLEEQLEAERHGISETASSPEGREGVSAFLEKRPAKFSGQ